jgi:glucokinase
VVHPEEVWKVSVSNRKGTVLAVDIGGTKIAAARVTGAGHIASRRREMTPTAGPQAVIDQLCQLLGGLRDESDEAVLAVGVGIPAVLEPGSDRVIWGPNLPGFRDISLRESLESILQLPVYLEYDGHTAVLGEWWRGAGRGFQNVVFVIIGTGIGGGMVLDGRLYRGTNRLAGAAGWFTLATQACEEEPDRRRGHWESLAAGPGIARRAIEGLDAGRPSRLSRQGLTAEQVFDAARAGDAFAQEIVSETARIIGIGVANIVSLVNPELVILGAGVGTQADLILEPVRRLVRTQAQPISGRSVRIEVSQLGEDAGLLGAAYTALERAGIRTAR